MFSAVNMSLWNSYILTYRTLKITSDTIQVIFIKDLGMEYEKVFQMPQGKFLQLLKKQKIFPEVFFSVFLFNCIFYTLQWSNEVHQKLHRIIHHSKLSLLHVDFHLNLCSRFEPFVAFSAVTIFADFYGHNQIIHAFRLSTHPDINHAS